MSDTPRTNKALKSTQGLFRAAAENNGFANLARQLERELAEARETIARLNKVVDRNYGDTVSRDQAWNKLRDQRDKAHAQLDRICKEGFDLQDTIGLEPADDYVLRMLAKEREQRDRLAEALEEYSLTINDEKQARAEFGDGAVDREMRRRAALAAVKGGTP